MCSALGPHKDAVAPSPHCTGSAQPQVPSSRRLAEQFSCPAPALTVPPSVAVTFTPNRLPSSLPPSCSGCQASQTSQNPVPGQDAKQAAHTLQEQLDAAHQSLAAAKLSASGQGQQQEVLQSHLGSLQAQLAAAQAALLQEQVGSRWCRPAHRKHAKLSVAGFRTIAGWKPRQDLRGWSRVWQLARCAAVQHGLAGWQMHGARSSHAGSAASDTGLVVWPQP